MKSIKLDLGTDVFKSNPCHVPLREAKVQTFNFCTSRPDVSLCLAVQTPIDNMSKYRPSTPMTQEACEKKRSYFQLSGHLCIHAQETEWHTGVRSCIMPGLAHAFSAGIKCRHCITVNKGVMYV